MEMTQHWLKGRRFLVLWKTARRRRNSGNFMVKPGNPWKMTEELQRTTRHILKYNETIRFMKILCFRVSKITTKPKSTHTGTSSEHTGGPRPSLNLDPARRVDTAEQWKYSLPTTWAEDLREDF